MTMPPVQRPPNQWVFAAAALVIIAVVIVATYPRASVSTNQSVASTRTNVPANANVVGTDFGRIAPPFELLDMKASRFSLQQVSGVKVTIMTFWRSDWNPLSALQALSVVSHDATLQNQVTVIAIDRGESADVVKQYLQDHAIDLTVLLDADENVSRAYQVAGALTTYFVQNNTIVGVGLGPLTEAQLRKKIDLLERR